MMRLVALLWCLAAPAHAHDDHGPYDDPGTVWQLTQLNGAPFTDMAYLEFPEIGRIEGQAPCNRFFGEMWSTYPWFKPEDIATTRMACPALKSEAIFLQTLGRMTLAEITDNWLLLTSDDGQSMGFIPAQPGD